MTDRIASLIVTLDKDIRDDDLQPLIEAIRMLRCVLDVAPAPAVGWADYSARVRVDMEWRERLIQLLDNKAKPSDD